MVAGRDKSVSASSVGSSLNFGPVPGMGNKPKALSRPSRDLLQGAHGVPPKVRGKCGSHANASERMGEGGLGILLLYPFKSAALFPEEI